ncbi:MAG: small acid-soluble spore protein Tlp [Clostridiaceae bacterium]
MKNKPDDRRDNVDRIQESIDNTVQNIRIANDVIKSTEDEKTKQDLSAKNARREVALDAMIEEIKDEAKAKENGYK